MRGRGEEVGRKVEWVLQKCFFCAKFAVKSDYVNEDI